MDKLILAEKLETLRRCVQRVEARRPDSVHNYRAVDWAIVFAISRQGLEDFRMFAKAMAALL